VDTPRWAAQMDGHTAGVPQGPGGQNAGRVAAAWSATLRKVGAPEDRMLASGQSG